MRKKKSGHQHQMNTGKMTMSDEVKGPTVQAVVMASIQAEDAGVIVNWKATCLQIVQAIESNAKPEAEEGKAALTEGD